MKKLPITIITIALLFILGVNFASADYNFYPTKGNNNAMHNDILGNIGTTYEGVSLASDKGSLTENIVVDYDNDGVNDLIKPVGSAGIVLIEGDDLSSEADALGLGDMIINPTSCDVNNDGKKEFVGIFSEGGNNTIYAIGVANRQMSIIASFKTNLTHIQGNLVCDNFYVKHGDNKNYVFWLDTTKRLHKAYVSGGFVETVMDIDNSVSKEASKTVSLFDSYALVEDSSFTSGGEHTIIYLAGDYVIGYSGSGTSFDFNYQEQLPNGDTIGKEILRGGINTGSTVTNLFLTFEGDCTDSTMIVLKRSASGFSIRDIKDYSAVCNGAFSWSHLAVAVGKINNDAYDDIFFSFGSNDRYTYRNIISMNNMSYIYQGYDLTDNVVNYVGQDYTPTVVNHNVVYFFQPSGYNMQLRKLTNVGNDTHFVFNTSLISSLSFNPLLGTFTPVDVDKNGRIDFIVMDDLHSSLLISNVAQGVATNYPYTVSLFNSTKTSATMKILTGFNTTSNIYNYATVCDLSEFTIWNEQFKSGYNFTAQNVSVNIVPPESFLSFYGMNVPIDNSTIQLDLLKNGNVGYYEIMRQKIGLTTVGNNTFDYLVFDSDNLITYWLRFNRTGTNLEISKIVFGSSPVSLANYTMSTNIENIAIEYSPIMDNMNNVPYFTTTIKVNNATVKTDSTYQFDGKNIKNVELFSESVGSSMFLTNFGLFKISNPTPTFVQFQNGLRTTIDDVTVVTPPPEQTIDGEGFSVVADYNNTFYGVCTYTKLGTYTQRHFLSPTNSLVYTNYKDIQVVITNATTVADTSDKLSSNDIGNWFKDLGITDGVTALIVGMLISIVFAGICMVLAYKLMGADGMLLVVVGIITLVVGLIVTWAIGLTPVWVIIMLVIICAGLVAVAFRYAVSGA